jgi:hypothetical protein
LCCVKTPANGGGGPPPAPVAQAAGPASAPLDPPELVLPEPLVEPVPELLLPEPLVEPVPELLLADPLVEPVPELLPPDPLDPEPEPLALDPPPESTGPEPAPLLDPLPHAKAVDITRGRPSTATRAERKNIHASV